jgi:carboxymethylenebutenolidase
MITTKIDIKTDVGICDSHFFHPDGDFQNPTVIFYMDALGIRQSLFDMAERLVSHGYAVLLPNLFYRTQPGGPVDITNDREKLMVLVRSLTNTGIMRDTNYFLDFLDDQPSADATRIGCVGYCMGGAFSLTAAGTFPERVAAAASFHGGRLATDAPDSPHLLAPKMLGEIYVGVAESDDFASPEQTMLLESALKEAGTKATVEIYPGTKHGWAVPDHSVYDRDGSEKHWEKLLGLFERNLKG